MQNGLGDRDAKRGRGRPRTFDRDEALKVAMHLFWRQGFDGTSMADLVGAMGIASPSIYAAFGSKEDLFREALGLYVRSYGTIIRTALRDERDLQAALRRAFREIIMLLNSFNVPRGCLVVLGIGLLGENDALQSLVRDARHHLRDELRVRFHQSSREEKSLAEADVEAAVVTCMAFYNGLSVEILDGIPVDKLLRTVDLFVERLLPR